jgi:hypothetical protein
MKWDELLERLAKNGHHPEELDFMESYGAVVRNIYPELSGRRPRCMFGLAEIREGIRFETYIFASAYDAEDFFASIGGPGWHQVQNLVFHTRAEHVRLLVEIIDQVIRKA